ncbi:MAG: DUF1080 domain-containing protein [Verrucomicrobiota bacterium]
MKWIQRLSIALAAGWSLQAYGGEFKTVLNGKDLTGLKTAGNWVYEEDGSLALKPREGERGWKRYDAYLWLDREYADFEFDLEYKHPKGGNSGVFFRCKDLENPVSRGIEVQILDSFGKKKKLGHHDLGGIIRTQGPLKNMARPAGEWNRITVTCKGSHLNVVLNGETIQDVDLSQTAMKDRPLKGWVGVQDHGQPFWVRNLRIREL